MISKCSYFLFQPMETTTFGNSVLLASYATRYPRVRISYYEMEVIILPIRR